MMEWLFCTTRHGVLHCRRHRPCDQIDDRRHSPAQPVPDFTGYGTAEGEWDKMNEPDMLLQLDST